jgi:hypothetical protein
MTETTPIHYGVPKTQWWYQEFIPPGGKATPTAGIDAAQTWLNDTIQPGTPVVFGNIDSNGDVRVFWYGTQYVLPIQPFPTSGEEEQAR